MYAPSLPITPALLRALGEGVARLNKGDLSDCEKADQVVADLLGRGYVYSSYDFIPAAFIVVNAHCHEHGGDRATITDEQRAEVLDLCPDYSAATSEDTLRLMAQEIAGFRDMKLSVLTAATLRR